jgi:hypothetical protein
MHRDSSGLRVGLVLPQPVLASKAINVGEFPFVVGDDCVAERDGMRRDEQIISADGSTSLFQPRAEQPVR